LLALSRSAARRSTFPAAAQCHATGIFIGFQPLRDLHDDIAGRSQRLRQSRGRLKATLPQPLTGDAAVTNGHELPASTRRYFTLSVEAAPLYLRKPVYFRPAQRSRDRLKSMKRRGPSLFASVLFTPGHAARRAAADYDAADRRHAHNSAADADELAIIALRAAAPRPTSRRPPYTRAFISRAAISRR